MFGLLHRAAQPSEKSLLLFVAIGTTDSAQVGTVIAAVGAAAVVVSRAPSSSPLVAGMFSSSPKMMRLSR